MFFWNKNKDEVPSSSSKKANGGGGPPKVVSIAASALGVDEDASVVSATTHATAATSGSAPGNNDNNGGTKSDAQPPPRATATVGSDASTKSGGHNHPNQVEDDDASSVMMNLLSALSFQPTHQERQHHRHDDYHGKDLVSGPLAPLLIPLSAGEDEEDEDVPTSLVGHKASALMKVKGAGFDVPPGVILTTKFFEPWVDELRSSKEWDAAIDRLRHSVRVRSAFGVGGDGVAIARPGDEAELRHCLDRLRKKASSLHLTRLQRAQMSAVGEELGASMGGTYAVRPSSTEDDVGITSLYGGSLNVRDSPTDHHRGLIRAVQKCFCSCLDERVLTLKIENRLNRGEEDDDDEDDEDVASSLLPDLAVLVQTMVPNLYVSGVAYSINPANNDYDEIVIRAAYGAGGGHKSKSPDRILVDADTRSIVTYDVGGKGVHEAKVAAAEQRCLEEVHVRHVADAAAQIQHSSLYRGSPPVDVEWAVDARDQLHVLQVRPVADYVPMDRSARTQPGREHRRRLYLDGNLIWGGTDRSTSPMSNDILSRGVQQFVGTLLLGRSPGSGRSADIDLQKGMGLYTDSCRCYLDLSMYLPLLMGSPSGHITKMIRESNPIVASVLDRDSSSSSPEEDEWDSLRAYRPPELPRHLRPASLLYWAPGVAWRSRRLLISYWDANNRPAKFLADYRRVTSDFETWANDPDAIGAGGGSGGGRTRTVTVADCLVEGMTRFIDVALRATLPALLLYERSASRIAELVAEASAGDGDDGDCPPDDVRRIVDDLLGGRTLDGDDVHSTARMGLDLHEMANMLPPSSYSDLDALAEAIENRDETGGGRLLPPGFLPRWDAFVASHGLRGPSEGDVASPKYGDTPLLLLRQMAAVSSGGMSSRDLHLNDDDPRERQRNAVARREEVLNELTRTLPRGKGRELRRCHDDCVRYADAADAIRRHLLQVQGRVWLLLVDRARRFVELGWLDRAEDVFQLHVGDVDEAAALAAATASASGGGSKKKRNKKNVDLRALVRRRGEFYRRVTATTTDQSKQKQGQQRGLAAPHFPPVLDSRGRIFHCPPRPYPGGDGAGSSLVGTAASPGVARGPVRILRGCGGGGGVGGGSWARSRSRSARPPIFRPGDVLVAPAADVGYIAPLLVGAAAVIFEVDGGCGGRGETLAREYGRPCVSGVEGATEVLRDGRIVEVDGDAGVVRFVSDSTQFGLQ